MSPPPALSQTTPALLTLWKAYERTLYAHKATTALHTYSDTHPRISRGAMPSEPNLSRDRPPMSARGTQRARRPSVSARRARSPPTWGGWHVGHTRRCYADRAHARARGRSGRGTSGQAARRRLRERARSPTPVAWQAAPARAGIDAEGRAGGKAGASTNLGREAATSVWQAAVPAGTRRARRIGQCCSPCGQCLRWPPIGGVSSSERVPRVRRRGEAAPLGRAWLEWGSCLETRASGAPAVPPDPKSGLRRWRFDFLEL